MDPGPRIYTHTWLPSVQNSQELQGLSDKPWSRALRGNVPLCSRSKSFCENETRDVICQHAARDRMRARKMIASAGWEKQNQRQGQFKIMCLILLPQIRAGILDHKANVSSRERGGSAAILGTVGRS